MKLIYERPYGDAKLKYFITQPGHEVLMRLLLRDSIIWYHAKLEPVDPGLASELENSYIHTP